MPNEEAASSTAFLVMPNCWAPPEANLLTCPAADPKIASILFADSSRSEAPATAPLKKSMPFLTTNTPPRVAAARLTAVPIPEVKCFPACFPPDSAWVLTPEDSFVPNPVMSG